MKKKNGFIKVILPIIIFLSMACYRQEDKYEYFKQDPKVYEVADALPEYKEFVSDFSKKYECDDVVKYEKDLYLDQGNKIKINVNEFWPRSNSLWIIKPDYTLVYLISDLYEEIEKTDHLLMTTEEITEKEVIYLDVDSLYGQAIVTKINGISVENDNFYDVQAMKIKVFDMSGLYHIYMGNDESPSFVDRVRYCVVE